MRKTKFTCLSLGMLKISAHIFISFLLAIISILSFVRNSADIQKSIRKGLPALDEWYYQKIYSYSKSLMDSSQPFVDSTQYSNKRIEILNFGDLFYRLVFKLLPNDISVAYFVSTLVLLTLWIFIITFLVLRVGKNNYIASALISVVSIMLFFGNSRLPNNEYPFARIISPQLVGLIWILTTLLILKTMNEESRSAKSNILIFLSYSFLIFFASFTYLYLLLSILGTLLALILNQFRKRLIGVPLLVILASLVGSAPFLYLNFQKLNDTRFIEASHRMGLVESRAPGGGLTIILCLLCVFVLFIIKNTKFNFQDSIRNTLNLSSLGILIASQSNLVTNVSIQFSYHFEIFALINCLILLSLILKKLADQFTFTNQTILTKLIYTVAFFTLMPTIFFTLREFEPSKEHLVKIQKSMEMNFEDESNLIVDVNGLQSTLRVYSKSRIYFQEDMIPYGYTNNEILDRYFISSGCSDKLTNDSLKQSLVYYIEAPKQKGESLQRYLKFMNLESEFRFLYDPLLKISSKRNESVNEYIKDLRIRLQPSNCLDVARQNEIDFILFDEHSEWGRIVESESLSKSSLGFEGIFFTRI